MIGVVTTLILAIRVGELFLDPFIGNFIDKTNTRWGKFKPWVIIGAILSGVALALLFTDLGGLTVTNPTLYFILFSLLYVMMDVFFSAKDVAIWSMIPAISFESSEREMTATYARIGSVFGAQLVTILVMPIVLTFSHNQNGGTGDPQGRQAVHDPARLGSVLGAEPAHRHPGGRGRRRHPGADPGHWHR